MYVKKLGLNSIKQKLDAHTSLSFNEYILAYIKRSGTQGQMTCMTYTTTWSICKIWQRIHGTPQLCSSTNPPPQWAKLTSMGKLCKRGPGSQSASGIPQPSDIPNHFSADQFPVEVNAFIAKELAQPFTPWDCVSPLRSRPKSDGS